MLSYPQSFNEAENPKMEEDIGYESYSYHKFVHRSGSSLQDQ